LYLRKHENSYELYQLCLSDKAILIFQQAEEAFNNKDFSKAIELYNEMLTIQPEISLALTLIGDAYFNMGQYDRAKEYLLGAIDRNFIDYDAHWF
jgi:tetratricopeptide (TPR) repeat protein